MDENWTAKLVTYVVTALITGLALGMLEAFIISGWFDEIQEKVEQIKKNRKRSNTCDSKKGDHAK